MPQITTVRVVRKRSVQPEQFGNAAAEVELVGNVLEGENHVAVARQMLVDSRALVYENLGMKLPASAVAAAEEVDTPEETATVETTTEETEEKPKRGRGRPRGSKNTAPKKETAAAKRKREEAEAAAKAAAEADAGDDIPEDDVPGDDDRPQISTNPEDRRDPNDPDIPEDDEGAGAEDAAEAEEDELTAEVLHKFITDSITSGKLNTQQAKQMQREMKVARVRDLDTPEKLTKAKAMIDAAIAKNEAAAG